MNKSEGLTVAETSTAPLNFASDGARSCTGFGSMRPSVRSHLTKRALLSEVKRERNSPTVRIREGSLRSYAMEPHAAPDEELNSYAKFCSHGEPRSLAIRSTTSCLLRSHPFPSARTTSMVLFRTLKEAAA